jgi:hypothetical protein
MTRERRSFYGEAVFSKTGALIPKRRRKGREAFKWSIDSAVGELLREPGYCGHVEFSQPPVHIYGLRPEQLRERERQIYEGAEGVTEAYTRRGRIHTRKQKSSTPTLLLAVASWPEPNMLPTAERDRWVRRIVRLTKSRWGHMVRGVYAHVDESFFHLHIWVDGGGWPMKNHHVGHGPAGDLKRAAPDTPRKELAAEYIRGSMLGQDWYHRWVGEAFGWSRNLVPRPRRSRFAALRERQEKIEAAEDEVARQKAIIAAAQSEVLAHTKMLQLALVQLKARESAVERGGALLREQSAAVGRLRVAVEDQLAIENSVQQNRYEDPGVF